MNTRPKPLALPRALNRQGVDGAYLLLSGTHIDDLPQALDALKPNNAKLDEPHRAPVSGDHVRRWREQGWVSSLVHYHKPYRTGRGQAPRHSIWAARGVAA